MCVVRSIFVSDGACFAHVSCCTVHLHAFRQANQPLSQRHAWPTHHTSHSQLCHALNIDITTTSDRPMMDSPRTPTTLYVRQGKLPQLHNTVAISSRVLSCSEAEAAHTDTQSRHLGQDAQQHIVWPTPWTKGCTLAASSKVLSAWRWCRHLQATIRELTQSSP